MWKVLVYDDYCRDVVAPLLYPEDLRKLGVTLNLYVRLLLNPSFPAFVCDIDVLM